VFGAQEGGRRVVHFLKDGSTAPTLDLLGGKHHNQPTDVVVDGRGGCGSPTLTTARHLWPAGLPVSRPRVGAPSSSAVGAAVEAEAHHARHHGPRSVLLSPDEQTLYVADGDAERGNQCQLCAYPVKRNGGVGPCKVLLAFAPAERGIEGMCLDSEGHIVACAGWKKGGLGPMIYVISASGTVLETHPAPTDNRCVARLATRAW
jgi:gluconolactonase